MLQVLDFSVLGAEKQSENFKEKHFLLLIFFHIARFSQGILAKNTSFILLQTQVRKLWCKIFYSMTKLYINHLFSTISFSDKSVFFQLGNRTIFLNFFHSKKSHYSESFWNILLYPENNFFEKKVLEIIFSKLNELYHQRHQQNKKNKEEFRKIKSENNLVITWS